MLISIKQIFKAISFALLAIAALIAASPLINVSELQFPERLDSASIRMQCQQMIKQLGPDSSKQQQAFYCSPSDVGLNYKKLSVRVDNETTLKCWIMEDKERADAPLLVMLHDINDSKIGLLPAGKEFYDRGFNICLVDLRAHGESEGNIFTLGNLERFDIAKLVDTLIKHTNNPRIVLMGFGIGANIALQASLINKNVKCLLLQSPTDSLSHYVKRYSKSKWGKLSPIFYPAMERSLEKGIGHNLETIVMSKISAKITISMSVIAGIRDNVVPVTESYKVFKTCASQDKEYWPVRNADHFNIPEKAGADYYNHLAFFINSSFPKQVVKKSRFRRLA